MTTINPFSTQVSGGQSTAPGAVQGGATTGLFAGGAGMNFWDFLLGGMPGDAAAQASAAANAGATTQKTALLSLTTPTTKTAADAAMTLPGGDTDIILDALGEGETASPEALAELALFLDGAEAAQGGKGVELADLRVERIQKRIDALNEMVKHLTQGLPASQKDSASIETLVARLDQQIEKLQVRLQSLENGETPADDASAGLLIALGLTPTQLAKMSQRIEEVEEKLGRELTVEDLVAGVANIVPPPQDPNKGLLNASAKGKIADLTNVPSDAEPTDDLAAQLNGLTVGGSEEGDLALEDGATEGGDKRVMRGLDLLQKLMTGAQEATANGSQKAAAMMKSGFSTLLNFANATGGDVALPSSWYQNFTNGLDFSSFDIQAGIPLTSAAHAAHITTAVQQAGQAHPATHIVSAHLTKAAQEGSSQTMTIQLDPPELGRVDIRLEFGADNSVKAHLMVEKVETYHMLQRDAHFLDRALTNAGLDTGGGSSLSFEMARDGAFDQQNGGGNGGNGRGEKSAESESDIIQSTMTWQVDPDSGHVRYSILA